ncbi:hypothetical protein ACFODL_17300 [Phenylobacterium terrae]|uniref:UrcA family protein n=1 Tax=Phenylobacterium terrae TaxID=2665495 RepID=A0ABW4N2C7_9CAUL
MQRLGFLGAAALAAVIAAPHAQAGETSRREAQRVEAVAASLETAVGEVAWTCVADRCVGVGPKRLDSMMKECRKVSAAVGPLASFERSGRKMSARDVSTCNRLAGTAGYNLAGAGR